MHRRKVAAQDSSSNCKRTGLNQKWWVKSRKRHYGTSNAFPSYDSKTPVSLWFKIQRHYELFAVNNMYRCGRCAKVVAADEYARSQKAFQLLPTKLPPYAVPELNLTKTASISAL